MSLIETTNMSSGESFFHYSNPTATSSNYYSSVELNFHENRGSCPHSWRIMHIKHKIYMGYNIGFNTLTMGRKHGQVHKSITLHRFKWKWFKLYTNLDFVKEKIIIFWNKNKKSVYKVKQFMLTKLISRKI